MTSPETNTDVGTVLYGMCFVLSICLPGSQRNRQTHSGKIRIDTNLAI